MKDNLETRGFYISKNERAEKLFGLRQTKTKAGQHLQPFDQPCELGYHCPSCKYKLTINGNFDERLKWSEYNGFIWCSVCNFDYPSCLCETDPKRATDIFLATVETIGLPPL